MKMKLLCLALVLVWLEKATPRICRCTGGNCLIKQLDTCYTKHSCFMRTKGGNTTYGCINYLGFGKVFCNITYKSVKLECCETDLCNNKGLPPKPYLPVPSIKLKGTMRRIVTVDIKDTSDVRAKIDGYVATMYTPGENRRYYKTLAPNTSHFMFNNLYVNTKYVIEVTSYRGNFSSERSKPLLVQIKTPVCNYYTKGRTNTIKVKSCQNFGCFSVWTKNGTNLELQQSGCWNDVNEAKCVVPDHPIPHVICTCHKRTCTPKTAT